MTKVKETVYKIYEYLSNELQIKSEETLEKVLKVRDGILSQSLDFPVFIIEASLKLNYPMTISNQFASMFFYFFSLDEDNSKLIPAVKQNIQSTFISDGSPAVINALEKLLEGLLKQSKSLNKLSVFQSSFMEFTDSAIRLVVKRQLDPQLGF